ncbi:hypothetical protein OUZ56_009093 [Daphnia magna]|uniref:Uncharacterized protein n=1 Tax=Daphnia magna TaxID=35525 RepID=A0ABR0AF94_9CRUS|nr:hypothetical protein OUZ56_009093 [Daphnia magna]
MELRVTAVPAVQRPKKQLGLRETVSKGRDRHPYIPVGLSRPSDWLSPSPHPIAPPPLLLVE